MKISSAVLAPLIFISAAAMPLSQAPDQQAAAPIFRFALEPPTGAFRLNDKIDVSLTIQNVSNQVVPFGLTLGNSIGNACSLELKNFAGDIVPRRFIPEKRYGWEINEPEGKSFVMSHLGPGQVIRREVRVGDIFLASKAGHYFLRVTCYDTGTMKPVVVGPVTILVLL